MTEDGKNGWHEAKALVMDSLYRLEGSIKTLSQSAIERHEKMESKIDSKMAEVYATLRERNDRWHVAPCPAVVSVKEDSGKQGERIKSLEENQRETTRGVRWLIGIGLMIIGLLSGILYRG